MTDNFDQLLTNILNCTICEKELPLGANPVLQIDPKAQILIVGQAPGIRVHKTGIPFNDPSGDRLRNWMNIDKETFYNKEKIAILPMAFCYPGTGKSGDLPPDPRCKKHWREKILKELPNIKLTLVIGKYAMDYHLKDNQAKNLTKTVENWQDYLPEIIPLPHPSPRNNIWLKKNPWFEKEVISQLRNIISNILSN